MLAKMLKAIKGFFNGSSIQNNLEAYIKAHNPQSSGDVDRLERQFYEKMTQNRNYF
jgi:hypothetical protein